MSMIRNLEAILTKGRIESLKAIREMQRRESATSAHQALIRAVGKIDTAQDSKSRGISAKDALLAAL